jgi:monofunctional biosynthetic peptidoglycan transglycosylase
LRKIIEIPMAMEKVWSKKRILEVYLNIAQWGDGIYGVEAAAKAYFGVTAAHLSSGQAVLMAASLPAPLSRNPAQPSLRQGRLAGAIKARMAMLNKGPSCLFLPQNAVQD